MTESKQVMEWQAQAMERGWEEGELVGEIRAYQKVLKQAVSSRSDLLKKTRDELTQLAARLEEQVTPGTNGRS